MTNCARSVTQIRRSSSKIARSGNAATAGRKIPPFTTKGSTDNRPESKGQQNDWLQRKISSRRRPFPPQPSPAMRQPATVAAKPQRRSDLPPGFLQKMARASAFIPQQWHQERNAKRKLFPRRGERFSFKPEEPSNHQKMKRKRRMCAHPWRGD
uniref:Uncharacterized protein n=1 Tax=Setaria viridis TaxID=4556 RepID=A0A4U6SS57_SETVI|nr:hypothetical protein SEVIR_9G045650v2 [Setaria viridis]